MVDLEEAMFIALVSILNFSSLLVNVIFIAVILRKTPADLSSYSKILIYVACVDFLSACCSFASVLRVQQIGGVVAIVYSGPCKIIGSQFCHVIFGTSIIFTIYANLIGQSTLLLLVSFTFRLWKLNGNTGVDIPKVSNRFWMATFISITYTVLALALVVPAFILAASYDNFGFTNEIVSYLDLSGGMADNFLARSSIALIISTYNVGFGAIFAIRRRLFARIKLLRSAERHNHQMIYRSLTIQMLLPLVYIVGSSMWLLDATGIVHSRTLQRSILFLVSIFPLASPIISMYFIPPYRRFLKSIFASILGYQISPKLSTEFERRTETIRF